jgi:hypothetical protein
MCSRIFALLGQENGFRNERVTLAGRGEGFARGITSFHPVLLDSGENQR